LKLPPTKNWRAMAAIGDLESLGTGLEIFFERISGDLWSRLLSKSLQPASLSVEPGEGGVGKPPLPSSRHWALRAQGWLHVRVPNLSLDTSPNNRGKSARRISKANSLEPMGLPSHISEPLNWSLDSNFKFSRCGEPLPVCQRAVLLGFNWIDVHD
jgi:hypothetical protein